MTIYNEKHGCTFLLGKYLVRVITQIKCLHSLLFLLRPIHWTVLKSTSCRFKLYYNWLICLGESLGKTGLVCCYAVLLRYFRHSAVIERFFIRDLNGPTLSSHRSGES